MILLWVNIVWATCGTPLAFRDAIPQGGEIGVSPWVQPVISFVGQGTTEDISLSLWLSLSEIPVSSMALCYAHESDAEQHCVWTMHPFAPLLENTSYIVKAIDNSGNIPNGWSDITFTTGSVQNASLDVPTLSLIYFGPREGIGVDVCDWPEAYTHEFLVELPQALIHRSVLDVYFLDALQQEYYVHTIFVASGQTQVDFRQVVVPESDLAQCHYVVHRHHDGQTSPASTLLCHDGSQYGTQTQPEEPPNPSSEPTEPVAQPSQEPNPQPEPTNEPTAEPNPSEPTAEPVTEPSQSPTSEPSVEPSSEQTNSTPKGGIDVAIDSSGCGGGAALLLLGLFRFRNKGSSRGGQ